MLHYTLYIVGFYFFFSDNAVSQANINENLATDKAVDSESKTISILLKKINK